MKQLRALLLASVAAAFFASGVGCELIASPDRTKIEPALPGSGGAGGGSSSSSSSSSGGGAMACAMPSDCPDPGNECLDRTCDNGTCGKKPKDAGTASATQTAGDCKKKQCDGSGTLVDVNDDTDVPDDHDDCTDDACSSGMPTSTPKASGAACGTNGALLCDGAGKCVGCLKASDCAGQDTECHTRTCSNGVCGVTNAPKGTALAAQTKGDCQVVQCDGSGGTESAVDNADVPNDNETCTKNLCTNGAPSNPPEPVSTACSEGKGTQCDGAGKCVECLVATDCPGQDTECLKRSCSAGVCGTTPRTAGTAIASQTAHDCKKVVCDGNGGTTTQNDDADLPDDNNPCTNDVCTAGVVSHTDLDDGASCGTSVSCLGGTCSGCATAADCPGTDDECKKRTCTAGACSFSFSGNGVAVTSQITGDCKVDVCDGAGHVVSATDDNDLPADDGKACTDEVCNGGVASHPNKPTNTPCTQNNGSVCSSTGACVACNAAAQCPGQDTDCRTRTCNSNVCGATFALEGTQTSAQTPGDCQVNQCDALGNIISVPANGDVPADDGNACTSDVCDNGATSHPNAPTGTPCTQSNGKVCDGNGACVTCAVDGDCGAGTFCKTSTHTCVACVSNINCGGSTPACDTTTNTCVGCVSNGDCGGSTPACNTSAHTCVGCLANSDCGGSTPGCDTTTNTCVQCLGDGDCVGVAGAHFCKTPAHVCVGCLKDLDCGTSNACAVFACSSDACTSTFAASGLVVANPVLGDCHTDQCDGSGHIVPAVDDSDVPADDGNECTNDVCSGGVVGHPSAPSGTPCNGGAAVCDGNGTCGQCITAADCPGADTACSTRVCISNTCGVSQATAGTKVATQIPGDCHTDKCDGLGNVVTVEDDSDLPADDGNPCTSEICSSGVAMHPPLPLGFACSSGATSVCDGAGSCVTAPRIASSSPPDGIAVVASASPISVTFNTAMTPATLTAQTTAGACAGSIQISDDNFASCIALTTAAPAISNGGATASLTPAAGLLVNRTYKIRVTTAATAASGVPFIAAQATAGFPTTNPTYDGSIVISQVYGGGGNSGALYKNDFIELHNRGTTAVDVSTWSVQYASAAGGFTQVTNLVGSIAPGAYYLVAETSGGTPGAALPTADVTGGTINMSATAGKVALVSNQTALGTTCSGASIVDLVGYGSTASCSETAVATGPGSTGTNTLAVARAGSACIDTNNNGADFTVVTVAPHNSATIAGCLAQNESGAALEADACDVQTPLSLNLSVGTTATVSGRISEAGVTGAGSANANVRAQLGFGPLTANPEIQGGWTWIDATYNASCIGCGTSDEYQATLTAPAAGTYGYVFRFSVDRGVTWTYCDSNAGDTGAGSTAGLTFETKDIPVLITQ